MLHPVFNLFVFFIFLKTTVSTLIPGDLPIHLKDVFIYRSSFPDAVVAQGDMPGPAHTFLPRAEHTKAMLDEGCWRITEHIEVSILQEQKD